MSDFNLDRNLENVADDVFLAPNATVFGDVHIGSGASIWFGAVIRGDVDRIDIGSKTNVQDNSVLHADPGYPVSIGDRVTVGHLALVHGATVEDDVLVGMRAVILNGAKIGSGSVIAAGALITEGMEIPPGSIVMGSPAKVKGPASEKHVAMIQRGAEHYYSAAQEYRKRFR